MGKAERKRPAVILQCVFVFKMERKNEKKPTLKSWALWLWVQLCEQTCFCSKAFHKTLVKTKAHEEITSYRTQIHGHTVKHRHSNSTCASQSLIKFLSVTADGHNVSLSAENCFALFGSSFPSPWQRSGPKHNGRQQLADWLTAKPLAPVAYRVI